MKSLLHAPTMALPHSPVSSQDETRERYRYVRIRRGAYCTSILEPLLCSLAWTPV